MKKGRWVWAIVLLSAMALLFMKRLPDFVQKDGSTAQVRKERSPEAGLEPEKGGRKLPESANDQGLSRNVSRIIYTRHAKCRMECRSIDITEVEEILQNGEINYEKSDLRSSPDPKYALEGKTRDGQQVRIVFANSPRGPVVITVIDLGKEWTCNCT